MLEDGEPEEGEWKRFRPLEVLPPPANCCRGPVCGGLGGGVCFSASMGLAELEAKELLMAAVPAEAPPVAPCWKKPVGGGVPQEKDC